MKIPNYELETEMHELITLKELLPSFGLLAEDQLPVCKYTVLSINKSIGDCAAYEGIGPIMKGEDEKSLIDRVKARGEKISEKKARSLFDEIEDRGLRYRL